MRSLLSYQEAMRVCARVVVVVVVEAVVAVIKVPHSSGL